MNLFLSAANKTFRWIEKSPPLSGMQHVLRRGPLPWRSLRWALVISPLFCLPMLMGCGSETYEARLKETSGIYAYLDTVETQLASPAWDRRDLGMTMRVPLPFRTPIPPPEAVTNEEDEGAPAPDPRQPEFLHLPGLVDAWEAPFPAAQDADSEMMQLYVLSNYDRFNAESEQLDPTNFLSDLESLLANAFQVSLPDGEAAQPADNVRFRHLTPPRAHQHARYVVPKDYVAIRFVSTAPGASSRQGLLFERREGDLQAAVLVICPGNAPLRFRQRLDLALSTWEITTPMPAVRGSSPTSGRPGSRGGTTGF